MGRFDFEQISESVLRLISTARKKTRIVIAVQHQDECSIAGQRIHSSNNDNNTVYVNIIDIFYVIVQARRIWDGT